MKRLGLVAMVIFGLISCNKEELPAGQERPELLPISNIELPTEFKRDSLYEIPLEFIRPTTCHVVDGIYYEKNNNVRTIAIGTTVLLQSNCTTATVNPLSRILNFMPTTESSYVFKIWKGKNPSGQDIFEEVEIPVVP